MALKLPRLQRTAPITDGGGKPTVTFHIWWDETAKAIETQEGLQDQVIEDLEQTQADLAATQADLTAAIADIGSAQGDITALAATTVAKDQTPIWADPSGTLTRTTFAAYAGQTVSNPPTQAQVQAIDNHLKVLSERLAALITDLRDADVLT